FCTATATTQIYTLSLHDALPISLIFMKSRKTLGIYSCQTSLTNHLYTDYSYLRSKHPFGSIAPRYYFFPSDETDTFADNEPEKRSEEHTSELQSRENLVCRLLLE